MNAIHDRSKITTTKRGLKIIDERALNRLLDSVPLDANRDFIKKQLPPLSKTRIPIKLNDSKNSPKFIRSIVKELGLLDEMCEIRRYDLCLGFFRHRQYSLNTVHRYLKLLRKHGLFGDGEDTKYQIPDSTVFNNQKHTRIIDKETYIKYINNMNSNFSKFNAPLLLAFYTGLRTTEILQITTYHLQQLTVRSTTIDVKRKNTSPKKKSLLWTPIYASHLLKFIDALTILYKDELSAFLTTQIDIRLFNLSPSTLLNRMSAIFTSVTGYSLPHGYGVHGNRTTVASIMYDSTPNLVAIQKYLQHRNISSTHRYVRADAKSLARQFNRITKEHFKDAMDILEKKTN
ncbi:MAG: tyrosine-type recombinase/integrase [Janthinobacterium lividum]